MSLDLHTLESAGPWVLGAIAVIGLVAAIIVKKVIGKIISLVLAALLVFFGWQQRGKVMDAADHAVAAACDAAGVLPTTFFGIDVTVPDSVCKK